MAELGLQVAELLLEHVDTHEDDVLRPEGPRRLHHEVELARPPGVVVGRLGLVVLQLGVLGLWPLFRLRVERVAEGVVRVVLEGDAGGRVPLGVLLGEALLGVGLYLLRGLKNKKIHGYVTM